MTDGRLVDRVRGGDEEAFQTLYGRFRDPLFRFACRLTASQAEAEDLVHDCFVGLFRGGYDPRRAALRTYLYAAIRNLARKHYRDSGREDFDDVEMAVEDSPLEELLEQELADEVTRAVAALPLLQREVLVLAEYEELPLEEVARIVEAEVGAVKSRLHRARAALRKSLSSMKRSA
jgi:RNA polymerase sigma-70 factor (ECF subfamily)